MKFNDFRCLFYKWQMLMVVWIILFCHIPFLKMLSQDVLKNCHQRSIKVTWMAFGRPRKSTSLPSLPSEFTATSQTPSCPSSSSRPDGRNGFSRRDWCHEVSRFSALMNTYMYLYICIYIYMIINIHIYIDSMPCGAICNLQFSCFCQAWLGSSSDSSWSWHPIDRTEKGWV